MKAKTTGLGMLILFMLILHPLDALSYSIGNSALHVSPSTVHIRESFRGAPITISAEIPKSASAILEVKGAAQEDHFLRQGRRGGLWMSVGEVIILGAPSVYYLLSTPDLPSHSDIGGQWGYNALQKQIDFRGEVPREGSKVLFEQFVKLKEDEGLYGIFPKTLRLIGVSKDKSTIEAQLMLPSNIPPGNYNVVLSVLNSGKLLEQKSFDFSIDMRGLPGLLASLAYEHAAIYGLIAVMVAIVTGFMMGLIFKGKSAH